MFNVVRKAVVFGIIVMVLGGCARSAKQENDSNEVQSSTISEAESIEKNVKETVKENDDGTAEQALEKTQDEEKVYLLEYDADYDYDGIVDKVYYKQLDYECYYYIEMSSAGKLYIGCNAGHSVKNIELRMCDIDGDGTDELTFEAWREGADYIGKRTLHVYKYKADRYDAYKLARQDEGHEFTISRDITKAQITCDETGFDYIFWDTILAMDDGYYFVQGTQTQESIPYWAEICEIDGKFVVRYVYSVGSRYSIDVEELVAYADGKEKTLSMTVNDSDITRQMRSVCEKLGMTDVQYDYEMNDEDKLLYDVHTLIKESGIDFSYHLSEYATYKGRELSMEVTACNVEDAAAVYELVQSIKEKCSLRKFSVDRFTEVYGKLARAKMGDIGTDKEVPEWIIDVKEKFDDEANGKILYYTYNEDYNTFNMIYECGGAVTYFINEGGYVWTLVFDDKPGFGYGGWIVGKGDKVQIDKCDVNNDGSDELVSTITDVDENTLVVVYSLQDRKVISPCTSEAESYVGKYDGEKERIVFFDYDIGKQIHEAVNEVYRNEGISKTTHIPSEDAGIVTAGRIEMAGGAKYKFELMPDAKLNLVYTLADLECDVFFLITDEGSVVDDIKINLVER